VLSDPKATVLCKRTCVELIVAGVIIQAKLASLITIRSYTKADFDPYLTGGTITFDGHVC
jgi:hypothetical protein